MSPSVAMIAFNGARSRSLTRPNHSGICRSRLQASCMRLMKLMYTGQRRNGKTVPAREISIQIGHNPWFATAARSGIEFGWPIGSADRCELKPQ